MSTKDTPGEKTGSDDALFDELPADWHVAKDDSEAILVHENGAQLIIRRTSPPSMPSVRRPSQQHGDHYSLEFQPAGREGLVPVVETGSKRGQRLEAERFAAMAPGGRPDVELFAAWVSEDQL